MKTYREIILPENSEERIKILIKYNSEHVIIGTGVIYREGTLVYDHPNVCLLGDEDPVQIDPRTIERILIPKNK